MKPLNRHLAVAAVALSLAGITSCGKVAEKASEKVIEKSIEDASGGKANVDIGKDGQVKIETEDGSYTADENGNVEIKTEDGTISSGGGDVPSGWPEDISLPDDLSVLYGADMNGETGPSSSITGSSDMSPAEMVDFFESNLDDWEVSNEMNSNSDGSEFRSLTLTSGDRSLSMTAGMSEGDTETALSLSYIETRSASN